MSNDALRNRISVDLGIPPNLLDRLIKRAPHTYKVYTIPKKTKGRRTIAQPARETKYIQTWLINNIFNSLPVHECATAYKAGSNIKNNAASHANFSFIAKFDFKDFFTSIKDEFIESHLKLHLGNILSDDDIDDIVRVSCIHFSGRKHRCLSIGAPSSPAISNSIMYEFDTKISEWCSNNKVNYTRYADDLTFSTNTPLLLFNIEKEIRSIFKNLNYPKLRLNQKKTIFLSKKHQRRVTGLILSNEGKVSLGRDRKRMISALVHKYTINKLSDEKKFHLQGLLSFASDIEPLFVARLRGKYGSNVIDEIYSLRKPS